MSSTKVEEFKVVVPGGRVFAKRWMPETDAKKSQSSCFTIPWAALICGTTFLQNWLKVFPDVFWPMTDWDSVNPMSEIHCHPWSLSQRKQRITSRR